MSARWYQVILLAITATLSFVQCDSNGCPHGYARWQYLDGETRKYLLCWRVNWSDESITFATSVETTGWVGLGFSPTGFMPESDVVIGWVKDGRGYLKDRFAAARTVPSIDTVQNVRLLSSREADGVTTLEFKRKLAACEQKDRSIEEGTTRIIFSYNDNDPISESEHHLAKHQVSGRVSINLLSGTGNVGPAPANHTQLKFNLLNPNVSIPATPTTYWCSPFKFPVLQNEAHIIRFDPVIEKNHEELVHRILIYQCTDDIEPFLGVSWDCDNPPDNLPGQVRGCRGSTVVTAWAIGGAGVSFPSNVGLPMSGATGAQYVLMETHYNNVLRRSTYVDSSGMDVYYTPTKRQYDGAILEIGHSVSPYLLIPPGVSDVKLQNTCPGLCTQSGLPSGGVNVFATMLHSHTVGTGVWVEHIRNKTKLPNIDQNYNYDFNFQDIVLLKNEVNILPGDDIQVFCRYDTTDRKTATIGGEGTLDEMCLAFLFVYPKPTMATCFSQISIDRLFFGYIASAIKAGYYVSTVNDSADEATRTEQFRTDLRGIDFSSPASIQQWRDNYLANKWRDYECTFNSIGHSTWGHGGGTMLEDIVDTTPTPGPTGPCVGITERPYLTAATARPDMTATTVVPDMTTAGPSMTAATAASGSAVGLASRFILIAIACIMACTVVG